jgi:MFS family permease
MSALSDVMPARWRAPSFGLLLAGFSLGFALAPQLALFLGRFNVSVLSLATIIAGLITVVFFLPETLPEEIAADARFLREERTDGMTESEKFFWILKRPIWELSILNRSRLFRLLSCLAFFSGMVSSGE